MLWCQDIQNIGLSNHKLKFPLTLTMWRPSQMDRQTDRRKNIMAIAISVQHSWKRHALLVTSADSSNCSFHVRCRSRWSSIHFLFWSWTWSDESGARWLPGYDVIRRGGSSSSFIVGMILQPTYASCDQISRITAYWIAGSTPLSSSLKSYLRSFRGIVAAVLSHLFIRLLYFLCDLGGPGTAPAFFTKISEPYPESSKHRELPTNALLVDEMCSIVCCIYFVNSLTRHWVKGKMRVKFSWTRFLGRKNR